MLWLIPRTRSSRFKPLVVEILKQNQEQINELAFLSEHIEPV
jgi:hypothetical protein